jgi:pimeloyl-ACP methyl ester carboxylesterase
MIKISIKALFGLIAILAVVYFLGPKPPKPNFTKPSFENAPSLAVLEQSIIETEKLEPGIKQGNEATIVWADSTKKAKTKVAFLYLHGFGASHHEGHPVSHDVAKTFGNNMFLARLSEHGVEKGDDNLLNFNAEDYVLSSEKALHIAKQLGDSVVILATSGGAAMALFLASRHPEIKGLLTYSHPPFAFLKKKRL